VESEAKLPADDLAPAEPSKASKESANLKVLSGGADRNKSGGAKTTAPAPVPATLGLAAYDSDDD
jgi:hypothetical protein